MNRKIEKVTQGSFEAENHYYTKVLNSTLHPLVSFFYNLDNERISARYCHLHPNIKKEALLKVLNYTPQFFPWGGSDLFYTATKQGNRKLVVIETNSCPSGQKSMPLLHENQEMGGYLKLISECFKAYEKRHSTLSGKLAVIFDKNYMEASGYASAMSEVFNEEVFLIPLFSENEENVKFEDGVLKCFHENEWHTIRSCLRYVTQKPWIKIPLKTKTLILNPVIACLGGGRNKLIASKAYDFLNSEIQSTGLHLNFPETINDVQKEEIPLWVEKLDYLAVIKVPYSNAGQGVFTITSKEELESFMSQDFKYDCFIIQSLIAPREWYPSLTENKFFHIGTIPNKKGEIFVADLRMMVISTDEGYKPVATYARRAHKPLGEKSGSDSWDMLGTNLSIKLDDNIWDTDSKRLMLMDRKDFNTLGLGLDDLIEAYIQTVLSTVAIDKLCIKLMKNKEFNLNLFSSLNDDKSLLEEIRLA